MLYFIILIVIHSALLFNLVLSVSSGRLYQERAIKHFCVYFYHLFLILRLLFSLLSFKLFNLLFNNSSRFRRVCRLTFSKNLSDIRSEFLLSHFSNGAWSFFFLYFSQSLFFLLITIFYQGLIFHCYRNIYICLWCFIISRFSQFMLIFLFMFNSSSWPIWPVLEWKRFNFYWLSLVFSILNLTFKGLMKHFKIRNISRNFRLKA